MSRARWELELLEGLFWRIVTAFQDYASTRRQVSAIARAQRTRRKTSAR